MNTVTTNQVSHKFLPLSDSLSKFYIELDQHTKMVKNLIHAENPLRNAMLRGHFEGHWEKIDELRFKLSQLTYIDQPPPHGQTEIKHLPIQPAKLLSDQQAMKILLRNIKTLSMKTRIYLETYRTRMDEKNAPFI